MIRDYFGVGALIGALGGDVAGSLAVRATRTTDASRLAKLHAEGFERGWGAGEFEQLLSDETVIGHVAEARFLRMRGFVLSRVAGPEAEILSIVVSAKARGRGAGALLLGRHLAALQQRGVAALFLEVEEGNAAAIALYRRYAFETVGKRGSYYKRADGSRPAAIVMRRDLQ